MKKSFVCLLLGCLLSGCCSYKISNEGNRTTLHVQNNGWKFLSCIPIAFGDPEYPNQEVAIWFTDSLSLEVNMMLVDAAMQKHGYTRYRNIATHRTEESAFLFLFKRYALHTSAELIH